MREQVQAQNAQAVVMLSGEHFTSFFLDCPAAACHRDRRQAGAMRGQTPTVLWYEPIYEWINGMAVVSYAKAA